MQRAAGIKAIVKTTNAHEKYGLRAVFDLSLTSDSIRRKKTMRQSRRTALCTTTCTGRHQRLQGVSIRVESRLVNASCTCAIDGGKA